MSETLTLVPYGSTTVGNTQLTRTNGAATIVSSNSALLGENAVKIIWTVNYTAAPNNRTISRQIVAILAKGGVANGDWVRPESIWAKKAGYVVTELIVSSSIFCSISLGLLMALPLWKEITRPRAIFPSTTPMKCGFRITMAMDLRRAIAVQAAKNDTRIYIPAYYDQTGSRKRLR